ncbi:Glucose--fructose oxidoreductase precursor [Lacunisphaera limnophila]|uniref:Glucose--fructose oxidoreductase n=1 Tax=Lacunisphaera limnophila TaxID=1838286 RepID=A0A1D8AU45_9BACT|nr:Gfo/Idh/MocA family oxidoreductase [Lacunisphaera limnophila]AOS44376.1 Glucose--fructose oxidoreductase precursor [Lacunisphaera limnophila]
MKKLLTLLAFMLVAACASSQESPPPVRLAIIGLVHDHVTGFLPDLLSRRDVQLVGIVEPNQALAAKIARDFNLEANLFYPSLAALRAKHDVQAVAAFTSTFDHLSVVEMCAPLGIHVMMEKPLAVSLADAQKMAEAARQGDIQLVVNYETTWYRSTHGAYDAVHRQRAIGDLRKLVIRDGHSGPAPICSSYFLDWLTDPVLNGGGALMDFGCYGANLATWLMDGQRPDSVFAVTQQLQPDVYPKVDDEATIVLTYPRAQAIIQASWNWPYGRKDMDLYGETGALRLPDGKSMYLRKGNAAEIPLPAPAMPLPYADTLSYFGAVVRGEIQVTGLSSIEVNLIVAEILDAAKESARTGKRITLGADSGADIATPEAAP